MASEWLRKESVASTVSGKSSVSSDDGTETAKSKSSVKSEEVSSKAGAMHRTAASEQTLGKKMTILKKQASKADNIAPSESKTVIAAQASAKNKTPEETVTGDLIDFAPFGPSASYLVPAATPPTSTEGSPRALPSTPSSSSDRARRSQRKEIFVPKGESKSKHLAELTSRQQRSISRRPKPFDAHVASLEKQIQLAQKSKHLAGNAGSAGAGLMAGRHAPAAAGKGGDGRKGGRTATGLRVRRPAPQCVEFPTARKVKEKADRAGKISVESMAPAVQETWRMQQR